MNDLLAQVYAEPDSDEPRVVLADLLMEQGDPCERPRRGHLDLRGRKRW